MTTPNAPLVARSRDCSRKSCKPPPRSSTTFHRATDDPECVRICNSFPRSLRIVTVVDAFSSSRWRVLRGTKLARCWFRRIPIVIEMLPPSIIDVQGAIPRDVTTNSRGLLSETICGTELRSAEVAATSCHVARYREEFDETIRTVSEPECSKRRIDSAGTGSTRSVPDGRSRQGFSKGSASLQSLVRRRSRRHGTSLPSEVELSSRQVIYPTVPSDLLKDIGGGGSAMFRNEEEARTATPTSTLIYATSSAQPSTSRTDNNLAQDVSTSASNVATTTGSNITSTTNGGRFGNVPVSLARTTSVVKAPGPSMSSSWNNSGEQESDYVVDPVQGNAYYKGQFLGKVYTRDFLGSRLSLICNIFLASHFLFRVFSFFAIISSIIIFFSPVSCLFPSSSIFISGDRKERR